MSSSRYADMAVEVRHLKKNPAFRVLCAHAMRTVNEMTKRDIRQGLKLTDEERGIRLGYIQAFGLQSAICDPTRNLVEECAAFLESEAKKGG